MTDFNTSGAGKLEIKNHNGNMKTAGISFKTGKTSTCFAINGLLVFNIPSLVV